MADAAAGTPAGPATAKSEATRAAILRATVRALRERGMHGIRVEDIAADAGISTGLLYYHFADRAELVAAGLREAIAADDVPDAPRAELLRSRLAADPETRARVRPWADALRTAVFDERLRPLVAAHEEQLLTAVARPDSGDDPLVTAVVALADGLRQRVLSDVMDADRADALLGEVLQAGDLMDARAAAVMTGAEDGDREP